jgi:hypothetical protein
LSFPDSRRGHCLNDDITVFERRGPDAAQASFAEQPVILAEAALASVGRDQHMEVRSKPLACPALSAARPRSLPEGSPALSWYVNGVPKYYGKAGPYANGNVIDSGGPTSEFVDFDPSRLTYNVMLKYGAPAIAAGTATGAPAVDILGVARAPQHTAGAYSYPK